MIVKEFQCVSKANIDICAGAIDGILIWIAKPTAKQAAKAKVNQGKFLCDCKGKFGLNCQAVSNVRGNFLDISVGYGSSSSDCLTFERSELFDRCEAGLTWQHHTQMFPAKRTKPLRMIKIFSICS